MQRLTPSPDQIEDVNAIVDIPADSIRRLVDHLRSLGDAIVSASKLRRIVIEALGSDAAGTALVRQTVALASFCRASRIGVPEAISSLVAGLRFSHETESLADRVELIRSELAEIISNPLTIASAKALHLSYDSDRLLGSFGTVIDLRPVFSDDASKALGVVIVMLMRISFYHEGERSEISIAFDARDLDIMIDELTRCRKKIETARRTFVDGLKIDGFLAGDETYGFSGGSKE